MDSEVIVKLGRDERPIRDLSLAKDVKEAHKLDIQSKKIAAAQKQLKSRILEKARKHIPAGVDTVTFIKDGTECKVGFPKTAFIAPVDVKAMREQLGDTFELFVEHVNNYKPTKKLLKFAEGKDELLRLISTKPGSPRVGFRIIKDRKG